MVVMQRFGFALHSKTVLEEQARTYGALWVTQSWF